MEEKNMCTLAKACLSLIKLGKTKGLLDKINMFYLVGSISEEEYTELKNRLIGETEDINIDEAE